MKPSPKDKVKVSKGGKQVEGIVKYIGSDGYISNKEHFKEEYVVVVMKNGNEIATTPGNIEIVEKWDGKSW